MKTLYVANDGKVFDNSYECEVYENAQRLENSSLIMLDCNCKELNFNEYENLDKLLEKCYCIKIGSNDDLEILRNSSLYLPNEIGEYYYDDGFNWCPIDYKIDKLETQLKKIKNAKEILMKNNNIRR